MNVQLLLLLALIGPYCTFTHASPTTVPSELDSRITKVAPNVSSEAGMTTEWLPAVATSPPATEPVTAAEVVTTEAVQEVTTVIELDLPDTTTAVPEPLTTRSSLSTVETEGPTEPVWTDLHFMNGATEADLGQEVVLENDAVEGLSSGQVVGIVIGALLAVVVVIAVVIAAVRRMGKYSP